MIERQHVIVRAYGDEPLDRVVCGHNNSALLVCCPDLMSDFDAGKTFGVGFPKRDAFVFDCVLFRHIRGQWEQGEDIDWGLLRPYRI